MTEGFTPKLLTAWREGYGLAELRADALAGLTVAIVALPLAMALGIASGASPDKGLVTAVVAGFLISALGGSRLQIGGPTGAFVVVIFNVIATHGYDGLVLATLLAGFILLVAGLAGLGRLIRFVPHPVITGFTAGIAVIIASSQVKDFLGLPLDTVPAEFIPQWLAYLGAITRVKASEVKSELELRGMTVDEAIESTDKYIDDALIAGLAKVRIIHGKGTGALRRSVQEFVASHPRVRGFADGGPTEGGLGVTVVEL